MTPHTLDARQNPRYHYPFPKKESRYMALSLQEQCVGALKRAKHPVIVLPRGAGADGFSGAFALASVLKSLKKQVDIVCLDPVPETLKFLKYKERVHATFSNLRKFVIDIDLKNAPLEELSYYVEDGKLSIFMTPRKGLWSERDINHRTDAYRYDLIITIGVQDLESLGSLFQDHSSFFYDTQILNIDHHSANEHYGQIDLVTPTATSNSEIVYKLVENWDKLHITPKIATKLLTGMIAKTQSFKTPNVTPRTLKYAGDLMKAGAKREKIVDSLFRTRSVETLRLWGRALARLKSDKKSKIVWTLLSKQDFINAGASAEVLPDVIDELMKNAPEAEIVAILYEDEAKSISCLISSNKNFDSLTLALPLKPTGTRELARVCLTQKNLVQAEKQVVGTLINRRHQLESTL